MDPGTALAVLGMAAATGQQLKKLRDSLKSAPDELTALLNEVSDIQAVLDQVVFTLERSKDVQARDTFTDLERHIERARAKLLELDKLVYYQLVKYSKTGKIQVDRVPWVRERARVVALQGELKEIRINLLTSISSTTL